MASGGDNGGSSSGNTTTIPAPGVQKTLKVSAFLRMVKSKIEEKKQFVINYADGGKQVMKVSSVKIKGSALIIEGEIKGAGKLTMKLTFSRDKNNKDTYKILLTSIVEDTSVDIGSMVFKIQTKGVTVDKKSAYSSPQLLSALESLGFLQSKREERGAHHHAAGGTVENAPTTVSTHVSGNYSIRLFKVGEEGSLPPFLKQLYNLGPQNRIFTNASSQWLPYIDNSLSLGVLFLFLDYYLTAVNYNNRKLEGKEKKLHEAAKKGYRVLYQRVRSLLNNTDDPNIIELERACKKCGWSRENLLKLLQSPKTMVMAVLLYNPASSSRRIVAGLKTYYFFSRLLKEYKKNGKDAYALLKDYLGPDATYTFYSEVLKLAGKYGLTPTVTKKKNGKLVSEVSEKFFRFFDEMAILILTTHYIETISQNISESYKNFKSNLNNIMKPMWNGSIAKELGVPGKNITSGDAFELIGKKQQDKFLFVNTYGGWILLPQKQQGGFYKVPGFVSFYTDKNGNVAAEVFFFKKEGNKVKKYVYKRFLLRSVRNGKPVLNKGNIALLNQLFLPENVSTPLVKTDDKGNLYTPITFNMTSGLVSGKLEVATSEEKTEINIRFIPLKEVVGNISEANTEAPLYLNFRGSWMGGDFKLSQKIYELIYGKLPRKLKKERLVQLILSISALELSYGEYFIPKKGEEQWGNTAYKKRREARNIFLPTIEKKGILSSSVMEYINNNKLNAYVFALSFGPFQITALIKYLVYMEVERMSQITSISSYTLDSTQDPLDLNERCPAIGQFANTVQLTGSFEVGNKVVPVTLDSRQISQLPPKFVETKIGTILQKYQASTYIHLKSEDGKDFYFFIKSMPVTQTVVTPQGEEKKIVMEKPVICCLVYSQKGKYRIISPKPGLSLQETLLKLGGEVAVPYAGGGGKTTIPKYALYGPSPSSLYNKWGLDALVRCDGNGNCALNTKLLDRLKEAGLLKDAGRIIKEDEVFSQSLKEGALLFQVMPNGEAHYYMFGPDGKPMEIKDSRRIILERILPSKTDVCKNGCLLLFPPTSKEALLYANTVAYARHLQALRLGKKFEEINGADLPLDVLLEAYNNVKKHPEFVGLSYPFAIQQPYNIGYSGAFPSNPTILPSKIPGNINFSLSTQPLSGSVESTQPATITIAPVVSPSKGSATRISGPIGYIPRANVNVPSLPSPAAPRYAYAKPSENRFYYKSKKDKKTKEYEPQYNLQFSLPELYALQDLLNKDHTKFTPQDRRAYVGFIFKYIRSVTYSNPDNREDTVTLDDIVSEYKKGYKDAAREELSYFLFQTPPSGLVSGGYFEDADDANAFLDALLNCASGSCSDADAKLILKEFFAEDGPFKGLEGCFANTLANDFTENNNLRSWVDKVLHNTFVSMPVVAYDARFNTFVLKGSLGYVLLYVDTKAEKVYFYRLSDVDENSDLDDLNAAAQTLLRRIHVGAELSLVKAGPHATLGIKANIWYGFAMLSKKWKGRISEGGGSVGFTYSYSGERANVATQLLFSYGKMGTLPLIYYINKREGYATTSELLSSLNLGSLTLGGISSDTQLFVNLYGAVLQALVQFGGGVKVVLDNGKKVDKVDMETFLKNPQQYYGYMKAGFRVLVPPIHSLPPFYLTLLGIYLAYHSIYNQLNSLPQGATTQGGMLAGYNVEITPLINGVHVTVDFGQQYYLGKKMPPTWSFNITFYVPKREEGEGGLGPSK